MYVFFHPVLSFICPILSILLVKAFDYHVEKQDDNQLKLAFGLSIGSIFLMKKV